MRIALLIATQETLKSGLNLIGVSAPDENAMKLKLLIILLFLVLLIIFLSIYFKNISDDEGILYIESDLEDYRVLPEDKEGIKTPDLGIYNLGPMKDMEKFIPLICGLKGLYITKQEEIFLRAYRPWGIILFKRNCLSEDQIKNLTNSIQEIYGTEIPILIDQEGGRVSRLNFKGAFTFPSAKKLFELRKNFAEIGDRIFHLNYKLISTIYKRLGINVNSIPVLDIPDKNESGIIGDRSFSNDRDIVAKYGSEIIDILNANGVAPIIKYIPGHGKADVDSHLGLPYVHSKKI